MRGDLVAVIEILAGLRSGVMVLLGGIGLSWSMCVTYRDGVVRAVNLLMLSTR